MTDEKANVRLGIKISETRKVKGLSQEALAELTNISLSTIQRIEKGMVNPRPYTLKTLLETLDLDRSNLILGDSDNQDVVKVITALKRMNLAALILAFIPLIDIILPSIIWKTNKILQAHNNAAGKIISFQLLWGILTLIGIVTSIFLSNLITGTAGDGLYVALLVYLIFVMSNVFVIVKTSYQLGKGEINILSIVPNLF